jgi:hypothetical protein
MKKHAELTLYQKYKKSLLGDDDEFEKARLEIKRYLPLCLAEEFVEELNKEQRTYNFIVLDKKIRR